MRVWKRWWRRQREIKLAGLRARRSRMTEIINQTEKVPVDLFYKLINTEEEIGRLVKELESK